MIVTAIIAAVLVALGCLGCFINKVPGPLIAYAGLLIMHFAIRPIDTWLLILGAVLVILCCVIDYKLVPVIGKRVSEYGPAATWGNIIGSMIGFIIFMWLNIVSAHIVAGIAVLVVLPYLFACLFELIARKGWSGAAKSAFGAWMIYIMSTLVKLLTVIAFVQLGMLNALA